MTLRYALALLFTSPLLTAGPSFGQAPPDVFGEQIDVRVVNVEVVVEDADGRRVHGLTRDDFRVLVDGREVPVGYFSEVRGGRSASGLGPGGSRVEPSSRVATSYLVFVDNYFSIGRDRNLVLDSLLASVDDLGPADHMAVVGFDGRKLQLFTRWTRKGEGLRAALQQARESDAVGLGIDDQLRSMPHEMAIRSRERRLKRTSLGVTAALRSFAKAPGRKVALLLSGGWPYAAMHSGEVADFGGPVSWGANGLVPIYETANLLGYTLYPINLPTFGTTSHVSAENAVATGPSLGPDLRRQQLAETLRVLARQTGGRYMQGDARRQALERVTEDLDSYYWLGLTPSWRGDDSVHRIEVVPRRPGLTVRHRSGFSDLSAQQEVTFLVESALLFGELPEATPLQLKLGDSLRSGFRKATVPLELTIPMDAVTMFRHQGQYVARLELRVAALDKDGDRNDLDVIPVVLSGPRPPAPGEHAVYETALELRKQRHELVVSLHDPPSGTILAAVVEYRP